ncbi:MAG: GldG family protein [Chloroflexi bacterium]|nr:GldG family protein [Chloroflexota bacterium]
MSNDSSPTPTRSSPFNTLKRWLDGLLGTFSATSLVAGAIGVVALLAALMVYLLTPELRAQARTLVAIGGFFLLLFILGNIREIKTALLGRRGKYGTNTLVMIGAFVGIVVLANYLGVQNHRRFDVTAAHQFSLSPQTVRILKGLKDPVKAIAFLVPDDPARSEIDNLLREYGFRSDKFRYEFVDPQAKPAVARQYEITEPTIVFESGDRRQKVFGITERDFTSAILKVTGVKQLKVYFLTGHGEHDITSQDNAGYAYVRQGVEADNYEVATLDLVTDTQVPADAAVVVIAGPQKPFQDKEIKALDDYLRRGGKALIAADPSYPPELAGLLKPWGITLGQGYIVDPDSSVSGDSATLVVRRSQYLSHAITQLLDITYYPSATAIAVSDKPPQTLTIQPLATTTNSSWLETDSQVRHFDEGVDTKGPLTLAVAMEGTLPTDQGTSPEMARLVVIGDSDFASNQSFYDFSNGDLFLDSVNWLSEEEQLISIRPKPPEFRRVILNRQERLWLQWSSIAFLPAVVALFGVFSWWRRR